MSLFTEILKQDLNNCFLNTEEFAAELLVNGVRMNGVWDESRVLAEGQYPAEVETWGLSQTERTLYLSARSSFPLPYPRQELDIDGTRWTVRSAEDSHGMLILRLYRNEG